MQTLLLIAGAGALGALARYGVSLWAVSAFGGRFPFGTLLVNVVGSLMLGFLLEAATTQPGISREVKLALGTGFMGSFTTFSTFGVETVRLAERGDWNAALLNVGLNVLVGLAFAGLGIFAARRLLG